jgi:hypothetical protein
MDGYDRVYKLAFLIGREWSKSWCYEIHEMKSVVRKLLFEKLAPIIGEDKEFDRISESYFTTGETSRSAPESS